MSVSAILRTPVLIGFRAQGLLGDVFRVGLTYVNLHKEHPERVENPLFGGSVANTPPESIVVIFRDDSPEDNNYGVLAHEFDEGQDLHMTVGMVNFFRVVLALLLKVDESTRYHASSVRFPRRWSRPSIGS